MWRFIFRVSFLVLYVSAAKINNSTKANDLPTLYEYYVGDGIKSGLSVDQPYFTLNGKNITIYSGALHYFRVHPDYWRDRLRKMRAAGLNAVETYVSWNLHEPKQGKFDFGRGNTDYEKFLDIEKFLKTAQEEDLFVLLRAGPYICAEFEFGGMPSWILTYDGLKIRTNDPTFVSLIKEYFQELFKVVAPLQFSNGGPIIALQVENEYGNTGNKDANYLRSIVDIYKENGVIEPLYTSDTPTAGFDGTLPELLATANFASGATLQLETLKKYQPNKPLMVMEYWSGWYDKWSEEHHTRTASDFGNVYEEILLHDASVNIYMFHGGSNWGFLNGANVGGGSMNEGYSPVNSSYDYDAPLAENGDYTDKYDEVVKFIDIYNSIRTKLPEKPALIERVAYDPIKITGQLNLHQIVNAVEIVTFSKSLLPMELLPIDIVQSFGYIVYKKNKLDVPANAILKIEGRVTDTVLVLLNGEFKNKILDSKDDLDGFGFWRTEDSTLNLDNPQQLTNVTLTLIVENNGRNNFGGLDQFNQHKGLWQGNVLINDEVVEEWEITPLEFNTSFVNTLKDWDVPSFQKGPALYKTVLEIIEEPRDTYIDMSKWSKGLIIVNGFPLSKYFKIGPQQTAYLPAPFLKKGINDILIFEHFEPQKEITFSKDPIFNTS